MHNYEATYICAYIYIRMLLRIINLLFHFNVPSTDSKWVGLTVYKHKT